MAEIEFTSSLKESFQLWEIDAEIGTNDHRNENEPKEKTRIQIPSTISCFGLSPKVIRNRGKSDIVFLNAREDAFYLSPIIARQMLQVYGFAKPVLKLWIVSVKPDLNYSKRRIIEEGWKIGVETSIKQTSKFSDIFHSGKGIEKVMYDDQEVDLPDVILPRIGAKITYRELALLHFLERFVLERSVDISVTVQKNVLC